MLFRFLADIVVTIHFAYVAFVVLMVPLTVIGGYLNWRWVRNRWVRMSHLVMILVVVGEAWAGVTCPLTTLENEFRSAAGQASYRGGFIANLLHDLMFFSAPKWVFVAGYTLFSLLVLATWVWIPPRRGSVTNQLPQKADAEAAAP